MHNKLEILRNALYNAIHPNTWSKPYITHRDGTRCIRIVANTKSCHKLHCEIVEVLVNQDIFSISSKARTIIIKLRQ
jgi:hypothetical protein